jgi:predicted Zn-dependent protease
MRRAVLSLLVAGIALAQAACTQVRNPATGELQYTSLSPSEERNLGQQEHPKALRQFGGAYPDEALQAYVEDVGERVKDASELADQPFTFTLLDSDVVNAFALPGGYVYVTRGLLVLADNEAELAGVLGHEVGHVTARHSAQRYDQAQLGQIGTLAAQLGGMLLGGYLGGAQGAQLGGQYLGQAGSLGAQAWVQSYSREQEFEADQLGIRYLGEAGYEPDAMATFLATLEADDAYRQRTQGGGEDEASFLGDWFRSHPRTPERVARAVEATSAEVPGAQEVDRDALLDRIDGMMWGEDPAQGVIKGTNFQHPSLKIAFTAPPGFKLQNSPERVVGGDGQGRLMLFDMAGDVSGDLRGYLQQDWVTNQRLQDLQSVQLAVGQGAVGFGRVSIGGTAAQAMFAAVEAPGNQVHRFIFADARGFSRADVADFETSLRSLRSLSAEEAAMLVPLRVRVVPVRPGDTVDTFVRQMQGVPDPRGLFALLNGLDRGQTLQPGDRVKVIRQDPAGAAMAGRAGPTRSGRGGPAPAAGRPSPASGRKRRPRQAGFDRLAGRSGWCGRRRWRTAGWARRSGRPAALAGSPSRPAARDAARRSAPDGLAVPASAAARRRR